MATIRPTWDRQAAYNGSVVTVTWTAMAQATSDVGDPVDLAGFSEKTIQVTGTLGAAGALTFEGSNENPPVNWAPLANRQGTAMAFTTLGLNTSQDRPRWVRPHITAGDGTTSLNCVLIAHRFDSSVTG